MPYLAKLHSKKKKVRYKILKLCKCTGRERDARMPGCWDAGMLVAMVQCVSYQSVDALDLSARTPEAVPLSGASCSCLKNLCGMWSVMGVCLVRPCGRAAVALFVGRQHAHISVTLS